ncbi:hypothetical protein KPH14_011120 [Odynerus spinipes]|uniref:Uncharacterized protein n=1 Tax=Odynerus spinipes TaxID=1348599 RepID=A0AAD9RG93_9HYME|nr:hypothetical protein KPH14_011120 [Odynerus spinipes]
MMITPVNCEALTRNKKSKSAKKKKSSSKKSSKSSLKRAPIVPEAPNKLQQASKRAGTKIGISLASQMKPYIKQYINTLVGNSNKNGTEKCATG